MVTWLNDNLASWASELDPNAAEQAARTSRLPIVAGHVALMPDAHFGLGATVGSVVPTQGAIVPACVGVDIGCGMAAVETDLVAGDLPDSLEPMLASLAKAVPSGVGKGHQGRSGVAHRTALAADAWMGANGDHQDFNADQTKRSSTQLGSLGSGNHFLEVCLDERDHVWVVLHSGSRGIGNQLAQGHIKTAKQVARRLEVGLEDKDLAYFLEGTDEFKDYVRDLLWAQDYARKNRDVMLDNALPEVFRHVGKGRELDRVNCHHNYSAQEVHGGVPLWITRKGAIRAGLGDRGVIPGSMGTASYIVEGLGNPLSYESCSHGAGRRMSRTAAKKTLSPESLKAAMGDRTWQRESADKLVDEHPAAYKDIDQVMADQADLVTVQHTLRQILNLKGT